MDVFLEVCATSNTQSKEELKKKLLDADFMNRPEIREKILNKIAMDKELSMAAKEWEAIGGLFKQIGNISSKVTTVNDFLNRLSTVSNVVADNAYMEDVLYEIKTSTNDPLIKGAASELLAYLNSNEYMDAIILIANDAANGAFNSVKGMVVDAFWDGINKVNPGVKLGMEIADALFDVTGETESIYTILALCKMEDAMFDATANLRNDFLDKQDYYTASTYVAAMEMCYRFAIQTNEYVEGHLETVFKSGWAKQLIKNQETYDIYKETLKESKNYLNKSYRVFYSAPKELFESVKNEIGTLTIRYDANEGSGAPALQYKEFGVTAYISVNEPIREGYKFVGWSERKTAKTHDYKPGDEYIANRNIVLYAVWREEIEINSAEPSEYTIKYFGNAPKGTVLGIPDNQTKKKGVDVNISSKKPVREGYTFLGWSTGFESEVEDKDFNPGSVYSTNSNLNLYAVWENDATTTVGVAGDIDGDGKANDKDLIIFRQYLDGKNVSVDKLALNVDGKGKVDEEDYTLLFKYLTGWNVKIYYGVNAEEDTTFSVTDANGINIVEKGEADVINESTFFYWTISSSHDWKIISTANWIAFSDLEGEKGNTSLKLHTLSKTDSHREALLTFMVNGETKKVLVTQNKAEFTINHAIEGDILAKDAILLTNSVGQDMNWTVTSDYDWEITKTEGTWYKLDKKEGAAGKSTNLKITTTAYSKEGRNEGQITFNVNGDTYSVVIYQQGPEPITELTAPEISIKTKEKEQTNTISWDPVENAEGYFIYRRKAGQVFWDEPILDVNLTSINDFVSLEVTYEYMVRAYCETGAKTIVSADSNVVSAIIKDNSISVDKTSADLLWNKGNEAIFKVTSIRDFDYEYENDCEDWLGCEISGNTLICTSKSVNYSAAPRIGKIKITNGINNTIITVTQKNEPAPTIKIIDNIGSTPILNGDNLGVRSEEISFCADTFNVRKIHVRITSKNNDVNLLKETKFPEAGDQETEFKFDLGTLEDGYYKVIVHSSNSSIENDPLAQRPNDVVFYFEKKTYFNFEVTHPTEGDILDNQPIEVYNGANTDMNWTVNSSHEWSAVVTKGNWFTIRKTSDTNLRITTTSYASNGGRNEWTIKFTVNGKTYSVNIYQQSKSVSKPQNVNAELNKDDSVTVSWNSVTNATGYRVYRKTAGTNTWMKVTDTTKTYVNDYSVEKGNVYQYYVEVYVKTTSGEISAESGTVKISIEEEFYFEVTHPIEGDILDNQPIEVYNGANTDMNWTVNSSHEWSAVVTKGNWFTIRKTSDTNLRITTTGYATNGGKNEGIIKFTVNGKTYSVNIYQEAEVEFTIEHPTEGDIIENSPIKMYNGTGYMTWTINSSHSWSVKSSASWCTFAGTGSVRFNRGKGQYKLVIDVNGSTSSRREATLTFTVGDEKYKVKVYQEK